MTMLVWCCQHDTLAIVPSLLWGSCRCCIEIKEASVETIVALFGSHLGTGCSRGCKSLNRSIWYCRDTIRFVGGVHYTRICCLLLLLIEGHTAHESTLGSLYLIQDVALVTADHLDWEYFGGVWTNCEWIIETIGMLMYFSLIAWTLNEIVVSVCSGRTCSLCHVHNCILLELRFQMILYDSGTALSTKQRDL